MLLVSEMDKIKPELASPGVKPAVTVSSASKLLLLLYKPVTTNHIHSECMSQVVCSFDWKYT